MSNQLQRKLLEQAGEAATIINYEAKNWSSITFAGEKHILTLHFKTSQAANRFAQDVKDERFTVNLTNRTLLCDLHIVSNDNGTVVVEALTLNE